MREGRGAWWLAALLVIALVAAPARAQEDDPLEQLRETREQLDQARDGLTTVDDQVDASRAALEDIDHRLAEAEADLAAVEGRLSEAETVLQAATERVEVAARRVRVETLRLEAAEERLNEREALFGARVAATYKYGTVTYADVLVESRDFHEFVNSFTYVRSAMRGDERLLRELSGLVEEVSARRAEVDRARQAALVEEQAATSARDEVAGLAELHRTTVATIAAERAQREQVLADLEVSQEHYLALVHSLEAESAALAEELRRVRWSAGSAPGAGQLVWPTDGAPGSGFGYRVHPIYGEQRFHAGVDIAAPTGQAIVTAAHGLVVWAGYRGGYGLTVVVDHGGGLATLYAHQSAVAVETGEVVIQGQRIGSVGTTGYSTGPHLHFEVRVNGSPQDPMRWF